MSKRFESIETSAVNKQEEDEEDIEDKTDDIDQEEILVVENHPTETDLNDIREEQERSSISRSVDIGVQVKFDEAIRRELEQEETTPFPETTEIEETEVINSHTIKVEKEFEPSNTKFRNPVIKSKVE